MLRKNQIKDGNLRLFIIIAYEFIIFLNSGVPSPRSAKIKYQL
jgi:hypothetical protein